MGPEILVPLASFAMVFGIIYVSVTAKNRERMSMIEKGVDPSTFLNKPTRSYGALKFGLLVIGAAIGLLIGNILAETTVLNQKVAYFSMSFLFGGIGLVTAHYLVRKLQDKDKDEEDGQDNVQA